MSPIPNFPQELLVRAYAMFCEGWTYLDIAAQFSAELGEPIHHKPLCAAVWRLTQIGVLREMTESEREFRDVLRQRRKDKRFRDDIRGASSGVRVNDQVNRSEALYDPHRDGWPQPESLTAALCGDPLPGRSALDQRSRAHG
jgi:hypothetical protein